MRSQWWKPAHRTYSGCSVPGVGTINRAMQLVKESACLISKMISLPQRNYWQKQKASLQKLPDKIPTSLGSAGDSHKRDPYPPSVRSDTVSPVRLQGQKQHIGAGNSSSPRATLETDWGKPPSTEICKAYLLKSLKPWKKHEPETMLAVNVPTTQILPRTITKWKQTTEPRPGMSHY